MLDEVAEAVARYIPVACAARDHPFYLPDLYHFDAEAAAPSTLPPPFPLDSDSSPPENDNEDEGEGDAEGMAAESEEERAVLAQVHGVFALMQKAMASQPAEAAEFLSAVARGEEGALRACTDRHAALLAGDAAYRAAFAWSTSSSAEAPAGQEPRGAVGLAWFCLPRDNVAELARAAVARMVIRVLATATGGLHISNMPLRPLVVLAKGLLDAAAEGADGKGQESVLTSGEGRVACGQAAATLIVSRAEVLCGVALLPAMYERLQRMLASEDAREQYVAWSTVCNVSMYNLFVYADPDDIDLAVQLAGVGDDTTFARAVRAAAKGEASLPEGLAKGTVIETYLVSTRAVRDCPPRLLFGFTCRSLVLWSPGRWAPVALLVRAAHFFFAKMGQLLTVHNFCQRRSVPLMP